MKNDLESITKRMVSLVHELAPVITGQEAEMQILDVITDELLAENPDKVEMKKMLRNMFFVGQIFK